MLNDKLKRIVEKNQVELSGLGGNLLSAAQGKPIKSLLVTSCRSREGKTTSAVSVAHTLAMGGTGKVLLVDGNLRRPKLHTLFGCQAKPGLTDYLMSRADLGDVLKATEFPNLSVLPCDGDLSSLPDIFEAAVFEPKLAALKARFDFVVFDGGSVFDSSEVCLAARYFDGVVFVVECERTKWEVLDLAKSKVINVGGSVLGVILNKRRYYVPNMLYGRI
jgi:protein-tyrosine kinase